MQMYRAAFMYYEPVWPELIWADGYGTTALLAPDTPPALGSRARHTALRYQRRRHGGQADIPICRQNPEWLEISDLRFRSVGPAKLRYAMLKG